MNNLYEDVDALEVEHSLLNYITECRKNNCNDPILYLVMQFCHDHNYDPEEVGDIIRDDYYLSEMIKTDCKKHEIIVERGRAKMRTEDW